MNEVYVRTDHGLVSGPLYAVFAAFVLAFVLPLAFAIRLAAELLGRRG